MASASSTFSSHHTHLPFVPPLYSLSVSSPIVPSLKESPRITLDTVFLRTEKIRRVGMSFHHAGSYNSGGVYGLDFRRSRSIHTEENLELQGPLDVAGTIKARSICFDGDFIVSDKIDAYGDIDIHGNLTAEGRIKAFGDIKVDGSLTASSKIKGSARLKLKGNIEASEVEIYGNVTVRGYLHCRRLIIYGSLVLIGPDSVCEADEYEMIAGVRTRRESEPDWDI